MALKMEGQMLNLYTEESLAKEGFLAPFQKQFHLIMD
jgi:hypothetical protein